MVYKEPVEYQVPDDTPLKVWIVDSFTGGAHLKLSPIRTTVYEEAQGIYCHGNCLKHKSCKHKTKFVKIPGRVIVFESADEHGTENYVWFNRKCRRKLTKEMAQAHQSPTKARTNFLNSPEARDLDPEQIPAKQQVWRYKLPGSRLLSRSTWLGWGKHLF